MGSKDGSTNTRLDVRFEEMGIERVYALSDRERYRGMPGDTKESVR